jgi:hypothetical protein
MIKQAGTNRDPIFAGTKRKEAFPFTTAAFESIPERGMCGVVDRQSAATGSVPKFSVANRGNLAGYIAPHAETQAQELESQHICEAKSFGRSLRKVKVEYLRTRLWCNRRLKPASEGDVDTRDCEGVLRGSS